MGGDLDDILDDALDDLDIDEEDELTQDISQTAKLVAEKTKKSSEDSAKRVQDEIKQSKENPFNFDMTGGGLEKMMEQFVTPEMSKELENMFNGMDLDNMSEADMMKNLTKNIGGLGGVEDMGEKMMENMFKNFDSDSKKEGFQGHVDGMLQQIVGKDVMYEPVKAIADKFPEWLATNESKISLEEYKRFGKQYEYFQRMVVIYESTPEKNDEVIKLMQEMQEFGNPPKDLIESVAPGLDFGGMTPPNGCPQM